MHDMTTPLMPVLFVGHGSPMNAIQDKPWSQALKSLSARLPRPRAVLAISAHWFVDGGFVTADPAPGTLHDFSGFPPQLSRFRYPAAGFPPLVERLAQLVGRGRAEPVLGRGLDHGVWSVLRWIYPEADVPVVQLSMDRRLSPAEHLALGRQLAPLRAEGILLLASGNTVHNLPDAAMRRRDGDGQPPDWARRFDQHTADWLQQDRSDAALLTALDSADGRRAHPTPEHWYPLLYAAGARRPGEQAAFFNEGFDWGSIAMRSVLFQGDAAPPSSPTQASKPHEHLEKVS